MTSDAARAGSLKRGWTALQAGDWQEARSCFEQAVAGGASPEAYEGLSWAAWWLDDAAAVFEAREQAFSGYRDAGDSARAARMATWLAADELDFNGALATASGWLERARRLLDVGGAVEERGWLAFHQGFVASLRGEPREAGRLGSEAARLGRETGVADLEMLGLALEGMSLVSAAEVRQGMKCLDEASAFALTGEAKIPISSAWTCCFMVTACTRVLDFERAFEWCDRIAEFAERYGSRYMLGFCRAEYATIHLWRGQWDDAERALKESLEAFSKSRPAMVGGPLVSLAELRRRQGRVNEAHELLDRAGSGNAAQLCRGRLALDRGDARLALEYAERVQRKLAPEKPMDSVPALELLARAQLALGELEQAQASSERLAKVANLAGTPALLARVRVVEGMLASARADHERARPLLEDAVDAFERCGARFDCACARIELGCALNALGRTDDARREAGAAHEVLIALGATVAAERGRELSASSPSKQHDANVVLSARETEVVGLLSEGLTNRVIAERLCISEHTVHRHVTSILRKLDVPTRTAAAAWALKNGLRPGQ